MDYAVKLHYQTIKRLKALCRGSTPARVMTRARVLLCLHDGLSIGEVAEKAGTSESTVKRVRRRFLDSGWEHATQDAPRPGRPRATQDRDERELIALACTKPPKGAARWTIRLLAKHSGYTFGVVQRVLKEDGLKPWREKNVVRGGDR